MPKGDDAVRRKKNKAICKKLRRKNGSSSLSAKVSAAIAAKKRRKAGKRRICQGMCFSLPTLEDPFNERHGKEEFKAMGPKKKTCYVKEEVVPFGRKRATIKNCMLGEKMSKVSTKLQKENESTTGTNSLGLKCVIKSERKNIVVTEMTDLSGAAQQHDREFSRLPSKFVLLCLSSIENALRHDDAYSDGVGNSLFVDSWGLEFLRCYSTGKDLMETSGTPATAEQIAWIISGAADTLVRNEQGLSVTNPFLVFLVPSQEKAVQVRTICKPLKSLGIHTVSVHPGASLDHQIQGLKSCEPEFLVATPERLLELLSLKAIDISGVSMLVVDGFNVICSAGHIDSIKSIKNFISGNPHLVVFNDCFSHKTIPMVRHLLQRPICRLSLNNSIASLGSCIIQSVSVCTSEEDKLVKSIQALDQFQRSHTHNSNMLYIIMKDIKCQKLVKALKSKGCSSLNSNAADICDRLGSVVSTVDMEHIFTTDIGRYDVVVLPNFVPSIDTYVHILTKMARESVNGMLHSFLNEGDAEIAGHLIKVLEQCEQDVPQNLQNLHHKSDI